MVILICVGHAFVMVFSISSKQSLTELKPILELITEVKGNLEDIPLVLVGNKNDEEAGAREVTHKTGETLQVKKEVCTPSDLPLTFNQEMWKCTYIETSAKNNYNIEAVFQEILHLEQKRQLYLQVGEEKEKRKKRRCRMM